MRSQLPQYLLTSKLNSIRDAIVSVIRGSQERLACSKAIKSHYRFATVKRVINRCHGEKSGNDAGTRCCIARNGAGGSVLIGKRMIHK